MTYVIWCRGNLLRMLFSCLLQFNQAELVADVFWYYKYLLDEAVWSPSYIFSYENWTISTFITVSFLSVTYMLHADHGEISTWYKAFKMLMFTASIEPNITEIQKMISVY